MNETPPLRSTARLNYRRYKSHVAQQKAEYKPEIPKQPELVFDDIAQANNETYKDRLATHYGELKTVIKSDVLPRLKAAKESSAKRLKTVNLPTESIQKIQKTKLFSRLKQRLARLDRKLAYVLVSGVILLVVGVNLLSGDQQQTLGVNAGPQPVYDAELGANIATEITSIDDVRVVISRQELPAKYRDASLLEELALSRSFDDSTQSLEITQGTAYLVAQEDDSQVVVLALGEQLILMTTDAFVLPSSWTNFIESLDSQS